VESWESRRQRTIETSGNYNGMPLAIAAKKSVGEMWPTPMKADADNSPTAPSQLERDGPTLSTAVAIWSGMEQPGKPTMWPTPQAFDAREFQRSSEAPPPNGGEKNLREVAVRWRSSPRQWKRSASGEPSSENTHTSPQLWPTPTRRDERTGWLDEKEVTSRQGPTLSDVAAVLTESQLLNPHFGCFLMGLPIGWTNALGVIGVPKSGRSGILSVPNPPPSPSSSSGTASTVILREYDGPASTCCIEYEDRTEVFTDIDRWRAASTAIISERLYAYLGPIDGGGDADET